MELNKKTTILLSERQHEWLSQLARQRGLSLGELIRTACEKHYGQPSGEERLAAVRQLGDLALPVDTPERMKRQSVPDPETLM